jgi:hypothetical protein
MKTDDLIHWYPSRTHLEEYAVWYGFADGTEAARIFNIQPGPEWNENDEGWVDEIGYRWRLDGAFGTHHVHAVTVSRPIP